MLQLPVQYTVEHPTGRRPDRQDPPDGEITPGPYLGLTPSCQGHYFVAVDGEGVGDDYVLLDSSLPVPRLYTGRRLSTDECLSWLWELGKSAPSAYFVLYGASYDINNWLRDLSYDDLRALRGADGEKPRPVRWGRWYVKWLEKASFEIRQVNPDGSYVRVQSYDATGKRVNRIGVRFYDVLPFWQCSFSKAMDITLGSSGWQRDLIEQGKAARGGFTHENMEWVSQYNKAECHNLVLMMHELDGWLDSVGIQIRSYHGPGAVANAMLAFQEVWEFSGRVVKTQSAARAGKFTPSRHVGQYFTPVGELTAETQWEAMLGAYAGGMVQAWGVGHTDNEVHEYDINSAYPAAMLELPCLSHGSWHRCSDYQPGEFGIYKIRYEANVWDEYARHPYFYRLPDGAILYPPRISERWAHGVEVAAGLAHGPGHTEILDGYVWSSSCSHQPFRWVGRYYDRRRDLKAQGNGGQLALKLGLNSLYGKLCQARGRPRWNPPWTQQFLWAGYITARTRAKVYSVAMQHPESVIQINTDSVVSQVEHEVECGDGLGQWEHTVLADFDSVQCGVYFGEGKLRSRGLHFTAAQESKKFLEEVHSRWESGSRDPVYVPQRRFIGAGLVASGQYPYEKWCTWEDSHKEVKVTYEDGHSDNLYQGAPDRIVPVRAGGAWEHGPSTLHSPHWGESEEYPSERELQGVLEEAGRVHDLV